jgi:hypothetical protein
LSHYPNIQQSGTPSSEHSRAGPGTAGNGPAIMQNKANFRKQRFVVTAFQQKAYGEWHSLCHCENKANSGAGDCFVPSLLAPARAGGGPPPGVLLRAGGDRAKQSQFRVIRMDGKCLERKELCEECVQNAWSKTKPILRVPGVTDGGAMSRTFWPRGFG